MAWSDDSVFLVVNNVYNYHHYWIYPEGKQTKNPKCDPITTKVLNFKDGPACRGHATAVQFFSEGLIDKFKSLPSSCWPTVGVIVPSSQRGVVSPGLISVMKNIESFFIENGAEFRALEGALFRHTTVAKNAHGGGRSMNKLLGSVRFEGARLNAADRVLVLDDVGTTQNTMRACKQILVQAGAEKVFMVVLVQTVREQC